MIQIVKQTRCPCKYEKYSYQCAKDYCASNASSCEEFIINTKKTFGSKLTKNLKECRNS